MVRHLAVALLLVALLALVASCGKSGDSNGEGTAEGPRLLADGPGPGSSTQAGTISWLHDLDEASQAAEAESKLVFVDFYTEWCGYCKKLDKSTFPDPAVQAALSDYVSVKINAEEDVAAARQYNVSGFPTMVILNSAGDEVGRIVGYREPGELVAELEAAASKEA